MTNQFFIIIDEGDSEKFRQLQYNTYKNSLEKLGYPDTRFWAISEKDKEIFEKMQIGDLVYFANKDDHIFSFCAKISGKEEESDLAEKMFGGDFRTKITKYILFFNYFYETSIIYHEMLNSTENEIQNNPGIYQIQKRFEEIKSNDLQIPEFEQTTLPPMDLAGPPPKIRFENTRFIRNTKKTHELKKLYENKCQICNYLITKPNNEYYSEVHHIWPLGKKPIGGDDDYENMLVLCPTHHAEFDYTVIKISNNGENIIGKGADTKKLFFKEGHKIAQKNIDQQFEDNIK